jgi:hypothetical protein
MPRGILKKISEDFCQIGPIDRQPQILANSRLESHPITGWRARKRGNKRIDKRPKFSSNVGSMQYSAAHAGTCQLPVDMPAHRLCNRFNISGDRVFTALMQARSVGGKRCERCLQSVCQISRSAARSLYLCNLHIEERIHFFHERLHFGRHCGRQMATVPGSDIGDSAAQGTQRAQAEPDLYRGGDCENAP